MVSIHRMAKLYGTLPSTFLDLDPFEYGFNVMVAEIGLKQDERDARRHDGKHR